MKRTIYLLLLILGFSIATTAQLPTASEIAQQKIKKITRIYQENTKASITWQYNNNGHETSMYAYGKRINYKQITYSDNNRIITLKQFLDNCTESNNSVYQYNEDGSYRIDDTGKQYGTKSNSSFNKKGQPVSSTVPDGSIYHYLYNEKGLLIKMFSEPKNGAIVFTNEYVYDTNGKLVTQTNTGQYTATIAYEYGSNGLLTKETITAGTTETGKEITVFLYEYGS